jgi:cysteine desulfurase / selenocysteine lyase
VEVVPSNASGEIDLDALERMLDERVRLLSIVHVPTNGGLVNPVYEATRLAHGVGALVLLDGCQSVGQLDVNVGELDVDALSATGRKWLRGPRGTGVLYVRQALIGGLEPPVVDLESATWTEPDGYRLRDDARRFELWEADVAARLGLAAAVDYLLDLGVEAVAAEVAARAERLRELLRAIPGVTVTDLGRHRSGIVSFTVDGTTPDDVRTALARTQVIVSVSGRTSTLLDMSRRQLDSVVRASPHYFVSDDQLEAAAGAVAAVAAR